MSVFETPDGGWTNSGVCITGSFPQDASFTIGVETNNGTIAENCPTLKELRLPNLKTSTGTIVSGCPKLSVLNIENLISSNNTKFFEGNIGIKEVTFPKLHNLSGYNGNGFIQSATFKTLHFPLLDTVFYGFINNSAVDKIDAPLLRQTGGDRFCYNSRVGEFYFPSTKRLGTGGNWDYILQFGSTQENYDYTKKVVYGSIEYMHSSIKGGIASPSRNCTHFEFGADGAGGVTCSLDINLYNPTYCYYTNVDNLVEDTSICSNNLEQFLYNFREYIVKRLSPQTSTKYVYMNPTALSYVLGTDSSQYAATWIVPGESDTYLATLNTELTTRNWGLAT